MPASPAVSVPSLSPGEMQLLLSRAGLALNPGQVADLVLAWRQVAGLIANMPRDRPLADDMAYGFRLAPPVSVIGEAVSKPAGSTRKSKTAAPKRRAPRPAGRKSGKRGR